MSRDDLHKCCDPEMSIYQEGSQIFCTGKASHNPWHQISNDDQVADTNTEAFNGDSRIKDYRGIWVCEL